MNERFWGYYQGEGVEPEQLIMFANWNGGSSIRRFDAGAGAFLGLESGAKSDMAAAVEREGPRNATAARPPQTLP